jgi:hypothetical protein
VNDICRQRSKADFDLLLRKFLDDLANGHVNSRANKEQHIAYARELSGVHGQTGEIIDPPESLVVVSRPKPGSKTKQPKKLKPRVYVPYEVEIMEALEKIGGDKLPNLYNSICSISLESHTPLLSIGVWALLESLSAAAGRNTGTDFPSFFNKSRLQNYGLATGKGDKAIYEALRRVSASGDVTKHDGGAALFNGQQLINDMETLKNLFLKCAEEAITKKA